MSNVEKGGIRRAVDALQRAGVGPGVASFLDPLAVTRPLVDAVLAEVPAFTESGNPDVVPDLGDHLRDHLRDVRRVLGGEAPGDFDFVVDHAERLAAQKFPLDAVLQAYRCL